MTFPTLFLETAQLCLFQKPTDLLHPEVVALVQRVVSTESQCYTEFRRRDVNDRRCNKQRCDAGSRRQEFRPYSKWDESVLFSMVS